MLFTWEKGRRLQQVTKSDEAISYLSGEKELSWDNIQQSNVTVLQNATTNFVVGSAVDRALPTMKIPPSAQPIQKQMQKAVDSGRNYMTSKTTNVIVDSFPKEASSQQKQQAANMVKDAWNIWRNTMNHVFDMIFHVRLF